MITQQIEPLSLQQVFDKVWNHFVAAKGQPSLSERGTCAYRGRDGAKCAIGVCIPDDIYSYDMDRIAIAVHTLITRFDCIRQLFQCVERYPLERLQQAHDSWARDYRDHPAMDDERFREGFAGDLRNIAAEFNLTIPS